MTDKEKLVEIVHNARMNALWHNAQNQSEYITDMLISDRVMLLPFMPGEKLYYVDRLSGEVEEDTVRYLTVTNKGINIILTRHNTKFWNYYTFGATVFRTRQEAEASMASCTED